MIRPEMIRPDSMPDNRSELSTRVGPCSLLRLLVLPSIAAHVTRCTP
jgi:hypothetical protein